MDNVQLLILIAILPFFVEFLLALIGDVMVAAFINYACRNVSKSYGPDQKEDIKDFLSDFLNQRWLAEKERCLSKVFAVLRFIYCNVSLSFPIKHDYHLISSAECKNVNQGRSQKKSWILNKFLYLMSQPDQTQAKIYAIMHSLAFLFYFGVYSVINALVPPSPAQKIIQWFLILTIFLNTISAFKHLINRISYEIKNWNKRK